MRTSRTVSLIKMLSKRIIFIFLVIVSVVYLTFPVYWMFKSAFQPLWKLYARFPDPFPTPFTLENFYVLFRWTRFTTYFTNSLIVSLASTSITVLVSIFGGYAIARLTFPGRTSFITLLLIVQLFPSTLFVIPLFFIINYLGLYNTYWALIITYATMSSPMSVWMMSAFIKTIPKDFEEAALVDGCSLPNAIFRVVMPIIMPGVVAIAIYAFLSAWSEFMYAITFIRSVEMKTVPMALADCFMAHFGTEWDILLSMSVLYTLPTLLLYLFFQRYIIAGLTGAIKF